MIARLTALLLAAGGTVGLTGGLLLGVPALALAVAPWLGLALLLGVGVLGGLGLALIRAEYTYRGFKAALDADTERYRLRLEAGTGRDVVRVRSAWVDNRSNR